MLIQYLFSNPLLYFIWAVSILLAMSIHEYSHAWMAYFLGDSTAQSQGRLTINPLAHLDPVGTLLLFTIGLGWGKPVPINGLNLKNHKWGEALVGFAGPFSNFAAAIIVGMILRFHVFSNPGLVLFFSAFVWINLMLGLFNLLPIPPLDGSHIFFSLPISENVKRFVFANSMFFMAGIIVFLLVFGLNFIIAPLYHFITGASPLL